jgi:hypothetical protein
MRKYATATALVIAPANAAFMRNGADIGIAGPFIAWGSANASCGTPPTSGTGTRNKPWSCPPLLQACIARCVAAKVAPQH